MRSLQYNEVGGPEVFEIAEVPDPLPGEGQVRVRVWAIGLNPIDLKISSGTHPIKPSFPSGTAGEFAGIVDAVGPGVTEWVIGDEVLGGAPNRCFAGLVVAPVDQLVRRPVTLSVSVAGGLYISGRTAHASVSSQSPGPTDTVLVSAAAGSVGSLTAQLSRNAGARVIGTSSPANFDYLRSIGVEPIAYGPGLAERLREAAPESIDIVFDTSGNETIEAALELGVPTAKMNTIAAYSMIEKHGIANVGASLAKPGALNEIVTDFVEGRLTAPKPRVFTFDQFREAYEALANGHGRGHIIVRI